MHYARIKTAGSFTIKQRKIYAPGAARPNDKFQELGVPQALPGRCLR
jgi:hypothetical protein